MMTTLALQAPGPDAAFEQGTIERRDVGEHDVLIDIAFAGICHSDIHTVRGEWGPVNYPMVTGHEIVGRVTEVGSEVTKFSVGERAGVVVAAIVSSYGIGRALGLHPRAVRKHVPGPWDFEARLSGKRIRAARRTR